MMETASAENIKPIRSRLPTGFTCGPVIGQYMGKPIYDYLIDNFGVKRVYNGITNSPADLPPNSICIYQKLAYTPEP